jgi:hypothetical protein
MNKTIAAAFSFFVIAALTPSTSALQVHLEAPDPARGLIGVTVDLRIHGTITGGVADTVYFVRAEKAAEAFGAESVIVSNFNKGGNVYLLNAEPGRYVAIGAEFLNAGLTTRTVVVFTKADLAQTEVEVRAGSVAFMGEIKAFGSMKQRELDPAQANSLNIILAHSKTLGAMDRVLNPNFAFPGVIKSVERGEAADSDFWNSASFNHFKYEPAWKSRIMARPILPVAGGAKPAPAPKP